MNLQLLATIMLAQSAPAGAIRTATCGPVCIAWNDPTSPNEAPSKHCLPNSPPAPDGALIFVPGGPAHSVRLGALAADLEPSMSACAPNQQWLALAGVGPVPLRLVKPAAFSAFARNRREADVVVPLTCRGGSVTPLAWSDDARSLRFVFGCGHGVMVGQVDVRQPTHLWMWTGRMPPPEFSDPAASGATLFVRDPAKPEASLADTKAVGDGPSNK